MNIRAVVLDVDGTILDTLNTISYYVNDALRACGFPSVPKDTVRKSVGNGATLLIRRVLAAVGETGEDAFRRVYDLYNKEYNAAPLYLTKPFDGIPEILAAWHARGVKIGVLSNKPHEATFPLVRHFFGDTVDEVFGGRPDVPLKPDPTALLSILRDFDITPAELVYIGDSGVDVTLGRRVGAALTVGVLWGLREKEELTAAGADRILQTPAELSALF